ncbi:MAG TPA: CPBP family intramembrane glutamic endopeptidase [Candidatus Binatia bacterium]|nr:CPBP family intramembrane glutamic endopeptidase [Candidatus Binatia bacterium]
MKSYQRVFVFLLLVLLLTVVLSPWMAFAWELFVRDRAGWEQYRVPFSRIFNRCFMIAGVILFFACRRMINVGSLAQLGFSPREHVAHDLTSGFALALASMIALVLVMTIDDVFTPYFRLSLSASVERGTKALLAAFTVAFLEAIFFQGIVFKGLYETASPYRAYVITNVFFAAIHFIQPGEKSVLTDFDPWAGLHYLVNSFGRFLDPATLLPGFIGLFLIGLVLSYAFVRTGTLYLSIALHAGWVFSIKTVRVFGDYTREDLGWFFGSTDPKIASGIVTWIGIGIVGLVVHVVTQHRARLTTQTG